MSTDFTTLSNELALTRDEGFGTQQLVKVQLLVNGQWLEPLRVDALSLERDYEESFADVRVLSLLLMRGQYTYDILPYRNNIQLDLTLVPLAEVGTAQSSTARAVTKRYRGFIMDLENEALSSQVSNRTSRSQLDLMPPVEIDLQLVEEYIFEIQTRTVGGIYRNETPYNVLRSVLTATLGYVQGKDEKRVLGLNKRGIENTTRRTQITIPHGTPVGRVANHLQMKEGGVFSTGLGCYLQDQYWYVFPLYDTEHGSKQSRSVTVYSVPTDRYQGSERTYRVTPNRLVIMAAGDAFNLSTVENVQLQSASGLRFLDAKKVLTDFGVSKNNRLLVDKASNLFEVTNREMQPGVNNIQWSGQRATSNPAAQYAALARLQGRFVVVEWMHSDPDLLEPGQLIEYMVAVEDRIRMFKGVLLGIHTTYLNPDAGAVINRHISITRLKLFIQNTPEDSGGG